MRVLPSLIPTKLDNLYTATKRSENSKKKNLKKMSSFNIEIKIQNMFFDRTVLSSDALKFKYLIN